MRDDSEEDEGRTEDALQEQDPNEEELRRRKKKRRSLDDSLGQEVASSARDVSTSLAHDSDEEEYSDETMLEIASQACLEGDFDAATRGFEECLSADANDVDAMNNYATMLFEHKLDVDKAEVLLRRALEIAPNSTTIMGNLALLLLDHRRRQDDAEQLFQVCACAFNFGCPTLTELALRPEDPGAGARRRSRAEQLRALHAGCPQELHCRRYLSWTGSIPLLPPCGTAVICPCACHVIDNRCPAEDLVRPQPGDA
eukprot:286700-Rhodomonas_salina.4